MVKKEAKEKRNRDAKHLLPVKVFNGMALWLAAATILIFNNRLCASCAPITALSVSQSCYTQGQQLTINFTIQNNESYTSNLYFDIAMTTTASTTQMWPMDGWYTNSGQLSTPANTFTGFDLVSNASAGSTYSTSYVINTSSSYSGTMYVYLLSGDNTDTINIGQNNNQYCSVASVEIDQCPLTP